MNVTEEMKKKRFQFLHKLYELTGGDESEWLKVFQIGEELGFDRDLTAKIAQYLEGERLIVVHSTSIGDRNKLIGISHEGIREVEEAVSDPDTPTYHFPPVNIIAIDKMISSQIQQASPEATQAVAIGKDKYEELKEVIQSLKDSIDQLGIEPQQKADLQAEIQTIDAQMSSSKPKATIITECLGSIRRIIEGAASSVLASSLLGKIVPLLKGE